MLCYELPPYLGGGGGEVVLGSSACKYTWNKSGHPEDGGNIVLRNAGILRCHCTVSQSRRPRSEVRPESSGY